MKGDALIFSATLYPQILRKRPFFLGIFWVAFDKKKQGWHDKLAGTVVVKTKKTGPEPVAFNN